MRDYVTKTLGVPTLYIESISRYRGNDSSANVHLSDVPSDFSNEKIAERIHGKGSR